MGINTSVKIGKITLKNPVIAASGTFGSGKEYSDFIDINKLGAIITKTITLKPRQGNPPPRLCETPAGLLNSIGLQNEGVNNFIKEKLPQLARLKTSIIVSVAADRPDEIFEVVKRLNNTNTAAIELNLSCPNVKTGKSVGLKPDTLIAQHAPWTKIFVSVARKATDKTLITKLSPNVTDITEIAMAAKEGGADAVSLVNTFFGMAADIDTKRPKLGNVTGGLSGPAIKPIALKMVWDLFNKVKIPIIGIGGIMDYKDALEFIICGATAVQVGTANFINPDATINIIKGIEEFLKKDKINNIKDLIGALKTQ